MEVREIKALVALMQEYGLVELEIEDKKGKVRLVRALGGAEAADHAAAHSIRTVHTAVAKGAVTRGPVPAAQVSAMQANAAGAASMLAPELGQNQRLVQSPMVGTFYRASSPDSAPFAEEGDSVRKGQPLCIIEAMKMMNEIEAELAGRVVKFLCDNGQPVQYGQPLIVLEIS